MENDHKRLFLIFQLIIPTCHGYFFPLKLTTVLKFRVIIKSYVAAVQTCFTGREKMDSKNEPHLKYPNSARSWPPTVMLLSVALSLSQRWVTRRGQVQRYEQRNSPPEPLYSPVTVVTPTPESFFRIPRPY